jgi:hypothetical protein
VVASYGASIPVVKGKGRVPGVVIRVSATHALYALCEGPVTAIRKIFRNDTGQAVNDAPGWFPYLGAADQVFPGATYGMGDELSNLRGIACMVGPLEDGRPADVSFEVATESSEEAIVREIGYNFGEGTSPANWTAAELITNAVDQDYFRRWEQARQLTDFAVGQHLSGGVDVADVVWFNGHTNTIQWTRRSTSGTWSAPVNITSTYAPQAGSIPQVQITSSASVINVIWSRATQAGSAVEIVVARSTDGGSSWGYSTITRSARAGNNGLGVYHLQASEVAGTVWVAFHQKSGGSGAPNTNVSCGVTVVARVGAGSWVYPATQTGNAVGFNLELGVIDDPSGYVWYTRLVRSKGPSLVGLTATTARLTLVVYNGTQHVVVTAPIKIDTTIKWDVDAAGVGGAANGATLKLSWAIANLPVIYLPYSDPDLEIAQNWGLTSTTALSGSDVLLGWGEPTGDDVWGWKIRPLLAGSFGTTWSVPIEPTPWSVLRPSIRYVGGMIRLASAYVRRSVDETFSYRDVIQYQGRLLPSGFSESIAWTERMRYRPETAADNVIITRFATGGDFELFTIESTNFDSDSLWENSLVRVSPTPSRDDALPGDVCRMLLTDRTRGARLDPALIDSDTWGRMDAYHRALGIYISPVVTQQGAAWSQVCEILESVNACPYWSAGLLKVFVRETAVVTNGTDTYTPKPEHAGPIMAISPDHLRGALQINSKALGDRRNILPVSYKDRTRNYTDVPLEHQDQGTLVLLGERRAATVSWPWITRAEVASRCAYLRLLREIRDVRSYRLEVTSAYLQLEPGDIVTVSDPANGIGERPMRITRVSESGSWISLEGEPVKVTTVPADTPPAPEPVAFPTLVAPAVNAPIVFNAAATLTGTGWEVWALLSWPDAGVGCKCQVSLDNGATWADIGACVTKSPTGWLLAGATDLAVRPNLAVHPFLMVGLFDRLESVDLSESGLAFPAPETWQWDAAAPGALMWLAGELVAYRRLTSGLPDQLRHGAHSTTPAQHPVPARGGAVTSAAFRWTPTPGSGGVQARFRFPSLGSASYLPQPDADAAQVILTIPAGV